LSLDTRQGRGYGGAVMMVIRADHAGLKLKETPARFLLDPERLR
jgi:hypothetical protein